MINPDDRAALLAFVDENVPAGCLSVWLTGSRANGTQRPDSDWDVLALHPDAPDRDDEVFCRGTALGKGPDGNTIELVIARPHRLDTDPRRYFSDCKQFGIRLR
jgi:predicted nucleotidyltransferase